MKLKKLAAIALAATMVLGLTACGSKGGSDLDYVKEKGTLVVGMTEFAPMDYKNDAGEWIGFDADMAKAFAESLGVKVEFQVIADWGNKIMELDTKAVDCVWNGMTLTEEVVKGMATAPYCLNAQVVVVSVDKAADYQTEESLKGLKFAVENGSAGKDAVDALGLDYVAVDTQAKALMEVAAGASDACVIDLLMAGAMIGEGTSYPELTYTVKLGSEEFGVGFRKESDLLKSFNDFWKTAYEDGTVMTTAETYGVQESVIAP